MKEDAAGFSKRLKVGSEEERDVKDEAKASVCLTGQRATLLTEMENVQEEGKTRSSILAILGFLQWRAIQVEISGKG